MNSLQEGGNEEEIENSDLNEVIQILWGHMTIEYAGRVNNALIQLMIKPMGEREQLR